MVCRLFGTKPLSEPILTYCQLDLKEYLSGEILFKIQTFSVMEMRLKYRLRNGGHFVSASMY